MLKHCPNSFAWLVRKNIHYSMNYGLSSTGTHRQLQIFCFDEWCEAMAQIYLHLILVVKTPASKHNYFASGGKSTQIDRQIAYAKVITPRQIQLINSLTSCLIRPNSSSDCDCLACHLVRCLVCCLLGNIWGNALGDMPRDHNCD